MGIRLLLFVLMQTCLLCSSHPAITDRNSQNLQHQVLPAEQAHNIKQHTSKGPGVRSSNGVLGASASVFSPSVNTSLLCPKLRIVILNAVSFHFEVLAGLLHVLQPYEAHLDVVLGPHIRGQNYDGAWDLLKWSGARFLHSRMKLVSAPGIQPSSTFGSSSSYNYDLAILVSADYELATAIRVLKALRPTHTMALVHNADWDQLSTLLSLGKPAAVANAHQDSNSKSTGIAGIAGQLELFSLAPHVAASISRAVKQLSTAPNTKGSLSPTRATPNILQPNKNHIPTAANPNSTLWMLASLPFQPTPNCNSTQPVLGSCLHGFSIQGKFSNLRRNYSSLWAGMTTSLANLSSPPLSALFRLNILGKGPDRLALPPALASLVTLHRRLPFPQFYTTIGSTIALLPSLAGGRYYTDKFSSTIITSLSTGTPVLASPAFAETYTMLSDAGAVLLQGVEEGVVDAMVRLMRGGEQHLVKARAALQLVQQRLNFAAFVELDGRIARLCKAHTSLDARTHGH